MAAQAYRVLYTKHLTKKHKTYHDGFIILEVNDSVILYDEDRCELSCSRLPSSVADIGACEALACFEGYLVNGDGKCDVGSVRKGLGDAPNQATAISASIKREEPSQTCHSNSTLNKPRISRAWNNPRKPICAPIASTHQQPCKSQPPVQYSSCSTARLGRTLPGNVQKTGALQLFEAGD